MVKDLKTIHYEITGNTGWLFINTPPANETTLEFFEELALIVDELTLMRNLGGLVIRGKGRHFSSGANLDQLLRFVATGNDSFLSGNRATLERIGHLPFPVISAIEGVCLGSAFELALHCHFRFCSPDAVLGLPESSFNLIPGLGGIGKMATLSGEARAMELILSGRTFGASEAYDWHLVDHLVPKKQMTGFITEFINSIEKKYVKEKKVLYLNRYLNRSWH